MSRRTSRPVVTTVDLPSGKTLEVVHPGDGDPYTRVRQAELAPDRDLTVCEQCSSQMCEPTDWESAGGTNWRVAVWCPNCHDTSEGVFSQECVDRLDERLDDATTLMVRDLRRLEQANMAEDVETFIGALNAGAILPEDFACEGGAR